MVAQGGGAICDVTSIYGLAGRRRERRPAGRVRNQQAPRGGPDQAGGTRLRRSGHPSGSTRYVWTKACLTGRNA